MLLSRLAFILFLALSSTELRADLEDEILEDIYGGTKSVAGEFQPMGWIGNCTGTAVASNAIFTAAHCVTNGKKITFKPRYNGQSYGMVCKRHPRVNTRSWYNDFAICVLESGSFPNEMPKASFQFRKPGNGEKLLLNGYGAPNVGTHYWGPETVDGIRGQDIEMCGKVYLGGGDSGGSLLAWSDDRSGVSGFDVLGVNSRGGGNCSYFNTVADGQLEGWLKELEASGSVRFCGVSADCKKPVEPVDCLAVYEQFADCLGTKGVPACILRADQLKECVK